MFAAGGITYMVGSALKVIGNIADTPYYIEASSKPQSKQGQTLSNSKSKEKSAKPKTRGQMQREVEKGKAPKDVDRVDKAHSKSGQEHVHLKDGSAVNKDGSFKDGKPRLNEKTKKWLRTGGYDV